jgi:hypothetical protein
MSFQAYLDSIKAKTGKTPDVFRKLAANKGLSKHGEMVKWLKGDFELGHGHANAVAAVLLKIVLCLEKAGFVRRVPDPTERSKIIIEAVV